MPRRLPLLAMLFVAGCAAHDPSAVAPRSSLRVHSETEGDDIVELKNRYANAKSLRTYTGKATYYSNSLSGHKMASGEHYDPARAQAAHRTLPFGTVVRVTNVKSRESVVVRITDRGPYGKGRIIDLSHAAAEQIGMIQAGVVDVRLEVLALP